MENMYERIIDLLGRAPSDPEFHQFAHEIGQPPEVLDHRSMSFCEFKEAGLRFTIDKQNNRIRSVFISLFNAPVRAGKIAPYKGNLPAGINSDDEKSAVRKKLLIEPRSKRYPGATPHDPKDYWDSYEIGPLELTFIFDGATKRMDALSIECRVQSQNHSLTS